MTNILPVSSVDHIRPGYLGRLRRQANLIASLVGGEAYLVGSALRPWTAERLPSDFDIRVVMSDYRFCLRYYPHKFPDESKSEKNADIITQWYVERNNGLFSGDYWRWIDEQVKQSDRARRFTNMNIDLQIYPALYWQFFNNQPRFRLDTRGYDYSSGELQPLPPPLYSKEDPNNYV